MADVVEVKAARAHRTGYAPGGKVAKGASYSVPASRVPALVRQKLIEDPAALKAKVGSKGKTTAQSDDVDQA